MLTNALVGGNFTEAHMCGYTSVIKTLKQKYIAFIPSELHKHSLVTDHYESVVGPFKPITNDTILFMIYKDPTEKYCDRYFC